ncbi:sulfurtransferase TusA family protein [Roseomonas alkaliterrae]|uniref:TusA-related sulfurtransferase n=2 Tax=Neoroseomonas alkaliterrae TaxID=1452450 RepID=A0A840YCK0_9PROT|nr:sulfurtransferase TusA family protein [Neoroseomonas alkaliterrae]MBB5691673.1 TusA-related sulfurtransferase [Neoroseomonas alkaliterrae]MBR0676600.1 sulfurtransferase TusA family protein [Neoroseomonas alkaliterrae]
MKPARSDLEREELAPHSTIDITRETCPMTFVRVRLALDRLAAGQILEVFLRGEEPRRNVPRTAAEQGHRILAAEEREGGVMRLLLERGA